MVNLLKMNLDLYNREYFRCQTRPEFLLNPVPPEYCYMETAGYFSTDGGPIPGLNVGHVAS
jgi:hypothetical protein